MEMLRTTIKKLSLDAAKTVANRWIVLEDAGECPNAKVKEIAAVIEDTFAGELCEDYPDEVERW